MILFDLCTIGLLLRLAPARAVLLYAWCPLVVKEIAFTAHPDGVAVCLLLAAVVLAQRDRFRGAAMCLALAVGAKVLALLLVPFVLARARLVDWGVLAGVLALLYLPFVLQGGTDHGCRLPPRERRAGSYWLPASPGTMWSTGGRLLGQFHAAIGFTADCLRCGRSSMPGTCSGCCPSP